MTFNNPGVSTLMQRQAGREYKTADSSITLDTLVEIAGGGKVVTPEKLNAWLSAKIGDVDDKQRRQFAQELAPVVEMNVNDRLVISASYSFMVLELEAYADRREVSMQESLDASTRAEQIRTALDNFQKQPAA